MTATLDGAPYGLTETGAAYSEAAAVPYTQAERADDINEWAHADAEQRSAAFSALLAVVVTDAYINQDRDSIRRLRQIRADHLIGVPA